MYWVFFYSIRYPVTPWKWWSSGGQDVYLKYRVSLFICIYHWNSLGWWIMTKRNDFHWPCVKISFKLIERGWHLCQFIRTKESVRWRKEFDSHRICLGRQHGCRFIILGHQYGLCDVMLKSSIGKCKRQLRVEIHGSNHSYVEKQWDVETVHKDHNS